MRKKVGIIKKQLAVLLIIAMSINSFGAIVSDNDGSAFITKSEFDALKSSFQSQIDSYNNSIDSKIDGAIAAYLAGINLSKTQMINTLDDYSGGARSIVADEWTLATSGTYTPGGMNWTMGNMGFDMSSQTSYLKNSNRKADDTTKEEQGSVFSVIQTTATNFKERMVRNYNAAANEASWYGYCTTKQNVTGSTYKIITQDGGTTHWTVTWGYESVPTNIGSGTEADPYILHDRVFITPNQADLAQPVEFDRVPLRTKTAPILKFLLRNYGGKNINKAGFTNKTAYYTYSFGTQQLLVEVTPENLAFERSIETVGEKYIILANNDTSYPVHRLSDLDIISGWTTDRDPAFSTGITLNSNATIFGSFNLKYIGYPSPFNEINAAPVLLSNDNIFRGYLSETDTEQSWFKITMFAQRAAQSAYPSVYPQSSRPYFGFMPEIEDWRKISNGNYNSLVDIAEITAAQQEGSSSVMLNHDGTELMIGAGLPVIKLEKNKVYKLKMKIDTGSAPNETGDYYIWFKDGTFTDGKKPQNESNLYEVTGISKDATGYIMPKGAQKEITLTATRDGYLFCKWRCKALNGGGILYIDKAVECITQD